jgi:hypothetical protein
MTYVIKWPFGWRWMRAVGEVVYSIVERVVPAWLVLRKGIPKANSRPGRKQLQPLAEPPKKQNLRNNLVDTSFSAANSPLVLPKRYFLPIRYSFTGKQ